MEGPKDLLDEAAKLKMDSDAVRLIKKAYDYGYEDGEVDAYIDAADQKRRAAEKLRDIAYTLEEGN